MRFLKQKKRKTRKPKTSFDKHHIFWIRKEWNKGALSDLRVHPYCVILLHRDTIHTFIHTHLAYIPAPSEFMAKEVIGHLEYLEKYGAISQKDPIEKRLKVLIALFECAEQPTADALKEQLRLVYEFYKKAPP